MFRQLEQLCMPGKGTIRVFALDQLLTISCVWVVHFRSTSWSKVRGADLQEFGFQPCCASTSQDLCDPEWKVSKAFSCRPLELPESMDMGVQHRKNLDLRSYWAGGLLAWSIVPIGAPCKS